MGTTLLGRDGGDRDFTDGETILGVPVIEKDEAAERPTDPDRPAQGTALVGGPSAPPIARGAAIEAGRGVGSGPGVRRIQWSVMIIPRVTSRLGMWHSRQPESGETVQGFRGACRWQERQAASYLARSVEVLECGSWQVTQLRSPRLLR
jgi:hypothetical protein